MPSPNVKFMASEKTDNQRSDWESDLHGFLQTAKSVWSSDMSGSGEGTLYGSVITDDLVAIDWDTRSDINSENPDFGRLQNIVENMVDTSTTDSVIVFDDYTYPSDGRAQIGRNHEGDAIRVGVCGNGGFNNVIALHETLHTFDALHRNHRQFATEDYTIMGAGNYDDCNSGQNWLPGEAVLEINNDADLCDDYPPTDDVVASWIGDEL